MHLGVKIDGGGRAALRQRNRQDRLLDRRRRLHLLASVLLGPDLVGHVGEGTGKTGERILLTG